MTTENIGSVKIKYDFKKLESLIKKLNAKVYTKIGILGGQSYEGGATVAGIGAVHEFGRLDGSIPERSFIRMPIEEKQANIAKMIKSKSAGYVKNGDMEGLFKLIGVSCEAAIQEAFDTKGFGKWEAIKEETSRRKGGSEAVLIDDGTLRKSISSEVIKKK